MNRYSFIETKPIDKQVVYLYTDGSCAPTNPGPGGIGIYCCDAENNPIFSIASYVCDTATNNQMEYLAMLVAIKSLKSKALEGKFRDAIIATDSKILHNTIENSNFNSSGNNPILSNLREKIVDAIKKSTIRVRTAWVPREKNAIADNLSKKGSRKYYSDIQGLDISLETFQKKTKKYYSDAIKTKPKEYGYAENNFNNF